MAAKISGIRLDDKKLGYVSTSKARNETENANFRIQRERARKRTDANSESRSI